MLSVGRREPMRRTAVLRDAKQGRVKIRIESLSPGAPTAGVAVVIDVFRAFTTAAIALSRDAAAILIVDSVDEALTLRAQGRGQICMGERGGLRPPGFDFGNSPSELSRAEVAGKTLILTTTNGTAGVHATQAAIVYAGALVTADATVRAILSDAPDEVTLTAMGREGVSRTDEDELCALYLRARLRGRQPDAAALQRLLATMTPPPSAPVLASPEYDPRDREIAMQVNTLPFAVRVHRENGSLVARRHDVPA
jgi:2-phosphosulfolactate phosphatase